ncbi:MAG: hypothetical protein Q7S00_02425, partial [bacterium]|nr:hypothetical protein [bacterium]
APTKCSSSDYTASLDLHYQAGGQTGSLSIVLVPTVVPRKPGEGCGRDPRRLDYEPVENVSGKFPVNPEGIHYFLRVDRLRGFIDAADGSITNPTGTDIADDFPHPYDPTYLPVEVDETGKLLITQIDECTQFILPSGKQSDLYFMGADIMVTTFSDIEGTSFDDGRVDASLSAYLFTDGLDGSAASVGTGEGLFGISVETDLTSGTTTETSDLINAALGRIQSNRRQDGKPIMEDGTLIINVVNSTDASGKPFLALQGAPLADGKMILVGIGRFAGQDFIGNPDLAPKLLIGQANAFIFLRMDVTLVQRED